MGKTTDRFKWAEITSTKNLVMQAKTCIAYKVSNRDVLMLISGFKLYNKLR